MGAGIAQVAAQAGHKVVVFDQNEDALARGRNIVAKGLGALVKRAKLTDADAAEIAARCMWTLDLGALAKAGLVIEAIVEDAAVKRALFERIEASVADDAVIATNTSSLAVTSLAAGLKRPSRFLGLHFFNPAPAMKLVEVIAGAETDASLAASAKSLMEAWGKTAVIARDVPGFIVNRVARPFYGEGWRALEEGAADAATIDFLYRDLAGFRMGPFELGDLIGHDVNDAAANSVFNAYHGRTRFTPSLMQRRLVEAGRLGRKSGRGVYSYTDDEKPAPSFAATAGGAVDPSPLARLMRGETTTRDGVLVRLTDGRTAAATSLEEGKPVALLDFVSDPATSTSFAFASSGARAESAALALARDFGKNAARLTDRPGLLVFRTLLQLANCGADAVRDGVATSEGVDLALMNGVNYPFGPMTWAGKFGFGRVVSALDAIAEETGEATYRPSEWLRAVARRDLL